MVSRETTQPLRKLVPAVAIGFAALLGIVGCGAGQVTQTSTMEPAVNGNTAQLGKIALRDVLISFPESGGYSTGDDAPLLLTFVNMGPNDDELVSVSSPAAENVELTGNTSLPGRSALQVVLPADNPAASTSASTSESSSASSAASSTQSTSESPSSPTSESGASESGNPGTGTAQSPSATATSLPEGDGENSRDVVGTMSIVLTGLTGDLPIGKTVPVTFVFAEAGSITVSLPIGAPATARAEPTEEHDAEGGH